MPLNSDLNNEASDQIPSKTPTTQGVTTHISKIELYRIKCAYNLGIRGFYAAIALSLILAGLTLAGFKEAQAVSNVVSPFLTVLGTLVGAFFGIQVGSAGREELAQQVQDANNRATAFAAASDPKALDDAVNAYNKLTKK